MDVKYIELPSAWPPELLLNFAIKRREVKIDSWIWRKIADKHPESESAAFLYISETITNPDYCGQGTRHFENIELIKRLPGAPLLVAIKVRDKKGRSISPFVASVYLIEAPKIQSRVKNGHLIRIK